LAVSHFWAILVLYDDYEKAGFFMLPTGKKDKGYRLFIYTWLIWLHLLPVLLHGRLFITPVAAVVVSCWDCGCFLRSKIV
jgi:protoheme IX farnesyltransferase